MSFALDPRLAADTLPIGDLALSRALLMNHARYPWLILVPRRADLTEIVDLDAADRAALIEEIAAAAEFVRRLRGVDKRNVGGALGNVVKQLHVHVLGRAEQYDESRSQQEPIYPELTDSQIHQVANAVADFFRKS